MRTLWVNRESDSEGTLCSVKGERRGESRNVVAPREW